MNKSSSYLRALALFLLLAVILSQINYAEQACSAQKVKDFLNQQVKKGEIAPERVNTLVKSTAIVASAEEKRVLSKEIADALRKNSFDKARAIVNTARENNKIDVDLENKLLQHINRKQQEFELGFETLPVEKKVEMLIDQERFDDARRRVFESDIVENDKVELRKEILKAELESWKNIDVPGTLPQSLKEFYQKYTFYSSMIRKHADMMTGELSRIGRTPEEVKQDHEILIKLRNELLSNKLLREQYRDWQAREAEIVREETQVRVAEVSPCTFCVREPAELGVRSLIDRKNKGLILFSGDSLKEDYFPIYLGKAEFGRAFDGDYKKIYDEILTDDDKRSIFSEGVPSSEEEKNKHKFDVWSDPELSRNLLLELISSALADKKFQEDAESYDDFLGNVEKLIAKLEVDERLNQAYINTKQKHIADLGFFEKLWMWMTGELGYERSGASILNTQNKILGNIIRNLKYSLITAEKVKEESVTPKADQNFKVLAVKNYLKEDIENIDELSSEQLALVYDSIMGLQSQEDAVTVAYELANKGINVKDPQALWKARPAFMGGLNIEQLKKALEKKKAEEIPTSVSEYSLDPELKQLQEKIKQVAYKDKDFKKAKEIIKEEIEKEEISKDILVQMLQVVEQVEKGLPKQKSEIEVVKEKSVTPKAEIDLFDSIKSLISQGRLNEAQSELDNAVLEESLADDQIKELVDMLPKEVNSIDKVKTFYDLKSYLKYLFKGKESIELDGKTLTLLQLNSQISNAIATKNPNYVTRSRGLRDKVIELLGLNVREEKLTGQQIIDELNKELSSSRFIKNSDELAKVERLKKLSEAQACI